MPRREFVAATNRHLCDADLFETVVQLFEALVELGHDIALLVGLVGQRCAPHAVVLVALAAAKEFGEARDQVGLREHHVHRCEHLELLGQFLHALAQVFCQIDGEFRAAAGQLGNACRHDDAVDRRLRTMALQQAQETQPFRAVLLMHRIAACGIEQDAFGREEPVAVPRAANAVDDGAVFVGERELQARVQHGAAFAGRRIADHDVPRQLIERGAARNLADLRGLDGFHCIHEARAQRVEFGLARWRRRRAALGLLLGLLFQHVAELAVGAPRREAAPQPHHEQQGQHRAERDGGPERIDLEGVGGDEQHGGECEQPDDRERARVGQHFEDALHRPVRSGCYG